MAERTDVVSHLNQIAPDTFDEGALGPWTFSSAVVQEDGLLLGYRHAEGEATRLFDVPADAPLDAIADAVVMWSVRCEGGPPPSGDVGAIREAAPHDQAEALDDLCYDLVDEGRHLRPASKRWWSSSSRCNTLTSSERSTDS